MSVWIDLVSSLPDRLHSASECESTEMTARAAGCDKTQQEQERDKKSIHIHIINPMLYLFSLFVYHPPPFSPSFLFVLFVRLIRLIRGETDAKEREQLGMSPYWEHNTPRKEG